MSASATQGGNKNGLQKAQKYVEYQKNFMQRLLHVMVNGKIMWLSEGNVKATSINHRLMSLVTLPHCYGRPME